MGPLFPRRNITMLRPAAFRAAAAGSVAAGLLLGRGQSASHCQNQLPEQLLKFKAQETEIRERWAEDEKGWRKLPARAWPPVQPKADDIPGLEKAFEACAASKDISHFDDDCKTAAFDLATALIFNTWDPAKGMELYLSLARSGHQDGMVAASQCLIEGLNVDIDAIEGMKWLRKAAQAKHPQAIYDLAATFYHGEPSDVPGVEENEEIAFEFFMDAASCGHIGGCFMVGDCLLDGIGAEKDLGQAVEWLYKAGERGHRGARSRLLAVLEAMGQRADGAFTDTSRMTYIKKD